MAGRIKFIVNPVAGQGTAGLAFPEIERLANEFSMDYEIVRTEYPKHAISLAHQAAVDGFALVVAVGGDGTSNEVLNGLMQAWNQGYKETCLGIIGIGRGNDFAYAFGIGPGIQAGFEILNQRQSRFMDVGLVVGGDFPQGRYFGNGIGIGFVAVVGFEAAKLTRLHGFANYIVAALRTIFLFFHAPLVRIEYNGKTLTQPALMISIMNGRRMGGGFMMAPDALTDDGQLELCIAGQVSRMGILFLIPQFIKGTQKTHPKILTVSASRVHIVALQGVLPVHADGETICVTGNELAIELIRHPIKILCG